MDNNLKMLLLVLTMAGVTFVIRAIPLTFFRKQIKNKYIRSVLYYIPYAVLSAMTFPYIFYSTGNVYTALIGTVVALVASLTKRSLIVVAVLSCLAVLIAGFIIWFFIVITFCNIFVNTTIHPLVKQANYNVPYNYLKFFW